MARRTPRNAYRGAAAHKGHGQSSMYVNPLARLRYRDPNRPKFQEDMSPIRCHLCGNVPRLTSALDNGECRAKGACTKRQAIGWEK